MVIRQGSFLRRLFSTFAHGWPGIALLLLRLVTGIAIIDRGVARLWSWPSIHLAVPCALVIAAGILLIVGLWTPIAGTIVAAVEGGKVCSQPGDPVVYFLLESLGP